MAACTVLFVGVQLMFEYRSVKMILTPSTSRGDATDLALVGRKKQGMEYIVVARSPQHFFLAPTVASQ